MNYPNLSSKIKPLQFKRGLSRAFRNVNPILLEGQPGFETDTHKLKIGDGKTRYNSLPYIGENIKGNEGKSAFESWKDVTGNSNASEEEFVSALSTISWGQF